MLRFRSLLRSLGENGRKVVGLYRHERVDLNWNRGDVGVVALSGCGGGGAARLRVRVQVCRVVEGEVWVVLVVLRVMEVRPNLMVLLLSHLSLYLGFYRHGAVRSLCHGPLGMLLFRGHGLSISWLVAGPTPLRFRIVGLSFHGGEVDNLCPVCHLLSADHRVLSDHRVSGGRQGAAWTPPTSLRVGGRGRGGRRWLVLG